MAKAKLDDPLLGAAQVVLVLFTIVIIFGMVMLGIGIVALLTVGRGEVMARIAAVDAPAAAFWVVIAAFLILEALLWLGLQFVRQLSGIIKTVEAGDSFSPDNADRLSRMGWIAVGGQLLALPLGWILFWLAPYLEKAGERVDLELGLDGEAILLILVLFILARVFREGTRMRDELEGTV